MSTRYPSMRNLYKVERMKRREKAGSERETKRIKFIGVETDNRAKETPTITKEKDTTIQLHPS